MATLLEQITSAMNEITTKQVHTQGTGGILNKINEYYKLNSKANSVPIISLITNHNVKTGDELIALIEAHTKFGKLSTCKCGIKSAGNVEDFSKRLYEKQLEIFDKFGKKHLAFDLESCRIFIHCLFITYSLKGKAVEDNVIKEVNNAVKRYDTFSKDISAVKAPEELDFKYGVDILVTNNKGNVIGVQVKPTSYLHQKSDSPVVIVNERKREEFEKKYGIECFYLYYEKHETRQETYTNLHKLYEILENVK